MWQCLICEVESSEYTLCVPKHYEFYYAIPSLLVEVLCALTTYRSSKLMTATTKNELINIIYISKLLLPLLWVDDGGRLYIPPVKK